MKINSIHIILKLVLLALGIQVCYSSQVEIELRQHALLTSSKYKLSDIANISSRSLSVIQKFSGIEIGRSPRPNYLGHISRSSIASRIESVFPGASQRITWLGKDIVQVQSIGVSFSSKRLAVEAEAFVSQWLREKHNDFRVVATEPVKDLILPPGEVRIKAKLVAGEKLKKRLSVWLDIYVNGSLFRALPVWVSISVFEEALIVRQAIDKSEALNPDQFQKRYLDITNAKGVIVENPSELFGMRAIKSLLANEILTHSVIQPVPAVMKGQRVSVSAFEGNVHLKTFALAMNDGELNQYIQVRNLNSNQSYSVVIIGPAQTRAD